MSGAPATESSAVARAGRAVLTLCSFTMLVALSIGGRPAEWIFALAATSFPVALIAAAGGRALQSGALRRLLIVLALLLPLTAIGLLALPAAASDSVQPLGLPPRTLLMLVGLGLLPLVLVIWTYAATFDRWGPTLEEIRSRAAAAEDRD